MNRTSTAILAAGTIAAASSPALADRTFEDEVNIFYGLCLGIRCSETGNDAGFGEIVIKDTSPAIIFADFAGTPPPGQPEAPHNDWKIQANDDATEENFFGIVDIDGGSIPVFVEAGAWSNSLRVGQYHQVGIGTMAPQRNLHIATGVPPMIRLEQDGSFGNTYIQTWDVGAVNTGIGFTNVTSGTVPFWVHRGAPDNALQVLADGNVTTTNDFGIGTDAPLAPLHLADPNLPRLRMETTGNPSGSWDVSALPNLFYISSGTSGNAQFGIQSGAPLGSMHINASGDVGLGTTLPVAPLHIDRTNGTAKVFVEETSKTTAARQLLHLKNNGIVYFTLEDSSITPGNYSGASWNFQNQNGTFRVTTAPGGPGEIEMQMTPDGNMFIKGELFTGTGGSSTACDNGCDRVFDADYPLPSIAEHAAEMKAKRHLPAVGPTDENGPFNLSKMTGGMLNELEKAHLYIAQLEEQVREIPALRSEIADLKSDHADRLAALEANLAAMNAAPRP